MEIVNKHPNLTAEEVMKVLQQSGTGFRTKITSSGIGQSQADLLINFHNRRLGVVSVQRDVPESESNESTFCNVPGCNSNFSSIAEFESHYNSLHRYNCAQCKRNLPSAHLLDLHLEETHDSYFEMLALKKASFRCFLEDCPDRFWDTSDRLDHGITSHKLPSNFRFGASTKEKKEKLTTTVEKMEDDCELKKSSTEVPKKTAIRKHITFGHNVPKSFDSSYAKVLTKNEKKEKPRTTSLNPLEDSKMLVDLLESLPT